ncbi:vacuolar amino acid transporter 4 [Hyphopichia burtonii NRRL Y-1933]|uniref:Vacuolar amino acid transporter 4 n=1 Tax=Hyphopichia burtonii NRRL Y-1933 TaxID=984485 RepID=A0A1E4RR80_9ASCO|nr:vacuolar amino acid transporter 4 [Hyphopichia burtonii NRRL Y-1933]ODV69748.1 vacuolar amino acid transporter 4 [Hyphopichia burtonii NRRL Y-1933]
MSSPRSIHSGGDHAASRRKSIAKLTRSPLSASPHMSNSPNRFGSKSNSFSMNAPFLKKSLGSKYDDDALETESSHESTKGGQNLIGFHTDEEGDTDFASGIDDPKMLEQINKHLQNDSGKNPLEVEGGDITRDLYRLGNESMKPVKRSRSLSSSDWERSSRRGSFASSLNVPGGFRREFIVNNNGNNFQTKNPNFLTKNFVEFLSIYGHFAGENLEDDDYIACHYKDYVTDIVDEESPLLGSNKDTKNPRGTASDAKAFFLLLKAFIGTGVLFLPKAFSNGGLLFSTGVLAFFGLLSFWCYLILVYAKIATKVSGFGEIGLKLYGKNFQRLILFSIVISQIGFVAAYIIFTAENLRAFSNLDYHIFWFILFQVIILVPLSLIRDITKLSIAALLANIFIFVGLLTIIYFTLDQLIFKDKFQLGNNVEFIFNQSGFSLFIGVAIFAFEGIGLIIPIQESMIYPLHFPKVLFKVIATISFIFILIGALGYITFGEDIQTVIILNLPHESPFIMMIQILYAFAILLSTPIQLFPAIRLIEQKLFPPSKSGKRSLVVKWLKNLGRCFFVLMTASIALVGGQNLDKFVSFVGCFACIPLVYMYPPILHLKSCCNYSNDTDSNEIRKKYYLGLLDYFLVFIGSIAFCYTTYQILCT